MLRKYLIIFGLCHSLVMLSATIWASLQDSILNQGHLFQNAWFSATLIDTYLGFLLVYLWIFSVTPKWSFRLLHLITIICLGNIMMGAFVAYRAYKIKDLTTISQFLTTTNSTTLGKTP